MQSRSTENFDLEATMPNLVILLLQFIKAIKLELMNTDSKTPYTFITEANLQIHIVSNRVHASASIGV